MRDSVSCVGFSPDEIYRASWAANGAGSRLKGTSQPTPPSGSAFSKILQSLTSGAYTSASANVGDFLDAVGAGVTGMGGGLLATADDYRCAEDRAASVEKVFSGYWGGPAASTFNSFSGENTSRVGMNLAASGASKRAPLLSQGAWASATGSFGGGGAAAGPPSDLSDLARESTAMSVLSGIPEPAGGPVKSMFARLSQLVERFRGDPGSISGFVSSAARVASAMRGGAVEIESLPGKLPNWFGDAFDAFSASARAAGGCLTRAAEAAKALGDSAGKLGSIAASKRRAALEEEMRAAGEILGAFQAYAAMILMEVPGALEAFLAVAAAIISGAMSVVTTHTQALLSEAGPIVDQVREIGNQFSSAAAALGSGGSAAGGASFAALTTGTVAQKGDEDFLRLMQHLAEEKQDNKELPAGFSVATDAQLRELGLSKHMLTDPATGLRTKVYANGDRYYVIFKGSDGKLIQDFALENIPGSRVAGLQTVQAIGIAGAIEQSGNARKVVFGGHSLGGRLAAVSALLTDSPAVTANAAGVSEATKGYIAAANGTTIAEVDRAANGGLIRAYRTTNDILTQVQAVTLASDAPGTKFNLPALSPEDKGLLGLRVDHFDKESLDKVKRAAENGVNGHMIDYLNKAYKERYGTKYED